MTNNILNVIIVCEGDLSVKDTPCETRGRNQPTPNNPSLFNQRMATRPRVLLLVPHTHLPLATRRLAQSTQVRRLNICRDRTKVIASSQSMLTTIVTKSMGGKVLQTNRNLHGSKLHDHTQAILRLCPNMIRTATAVPCTRCLMPKSRVQCTRQLLCIGPTPLHRNTLKHLTHRIIITPRQTKTTRKPLPKQLQPTQPLYVHLHHVVTNNIPSERRC